MGLRRFIVDIFGSPPGTNRQSSSSAGREMIRKRRALTIKTSGGFSLWTREVYHAVEKPWPHRTRLGSTFCCSFPCLLALILAKRGDLSCTWVGKEATRKMRMNTIENRLTEHDVAKLLRISVATIRRRRHFGQPPEFVKIGASVRYQPEAAQKLIESATWGSIGQRAGREGTKNSRGNRDN
jgi:hypothetical protein